MLPDQSAGRMPTADESGRTVALGELGAFGEPLAGNILHVGADLDGEVLVRLVAGSGRRRPGHLVVQPLFPSGDGPLAPVKHGLSRSLTEGLRCWFARIRQIPKLTVRVRFPSSAPFSQVKGFERAVASQRILIRAISWPSLLPVGLLD